MKAKHNGHAAKQRLQDQLRQLNNKLSDVDPDSPEARSIEVELQDVEWELEDLEEDLSEQGDEGEEEREDGHWTREEIEDERRIEAESTQQERQKPRRKKQSTDPFDGILYSQGNYARFPLPLLALPKSRAELVSMLRSYAIVYVAKIIYRSDADVMKLPHPSRTPKGFDLNNRKHRAVGAAMFRLKRRGGSIKRLNRSWSNSRSFLSDNELIEKQPNVTIALALLAPAASRHDLSERDLRVLMACNSCFGEKRWNIINSELIARRAVGAKDEATLKKLGVAPLSRRQVQLALEKLQKRGLIRRYVHGRRTTFAATGQMPEEEFQDIVAGWLRRQKVAGKAVPVFSDNSGNVTFGVRGNTDLEEW